jgi:predicted dehydrogenase
LADPNIDAVEVITPHNLHVAIGVAALEAGKHVSMQKPMALNVQECDAIIEASRRSGKVLRVFENFRHYAPMAKAKELLDSGAIGEPLSIRMKVVKGSRPGWEIPYKRWAWRQDPAQGGGGRIMFDYGSHLFNIATWYMGDMEKVYSWVSYTTGQFGWIWDTPAVVIWKYKNAEKYGSFEIVWSDDIMLNSKYVPEDEWVELTGSRGFIWVNRCSGNLLGRPAVVMYRDGVTTDFAFSDTDLDWASSFVAGVHDFVDAILEGRQPGCTGEEGRMAIQICRAVELSAKEGREVRPEEIK